MVCENWGGRGWRNASLCPLLCALMHSSPSWQSTPTTTQHGTAQRQHAPHHVLTYASFQSPLGHGMDPLLRQSYHSLALNVQAASSQVYLNLLSSPVALSVPFFLPPWLIHLLEERTSSCCLVYQCPYLLSSLSSPPMFGSTPPLNSSSGFGVHPSEHVFWCC